MSQKIKFSSFSKLLLFFYCLFVTFSVCSSRHFDDDNDEVRRTNQKMHADMHPSESIDSMNEQRNQRLIEQANMLSANLQRQKDEREKMVQDYERQLKEKETAWQGALTVALAKRGKSADGGSKIVEETPLTKCLDELREGRSSTSLQKNEATEELIQVHAAAEKEKKRLNEQLNIVEIQYNKAVEIKEEKSKERTSEYGEVMKERVDAESKTLEDRISELEKMKKEKIEQLEVINNINNSQKLTVKLSHWQIDSLASMIIISPMSFVVILFLFYRKCDPVRTADVKINLRRLSMFISRFLCFISFCLAIISMVYDDPFDDQFYYQTIKHESEDSNLVDNWNQWSVHTIRSLQSEICLILFVYVTCLIITMLTFSGMNAASPGGGERGGLNTSDVYMNFIWARCLQLSLILFIVLMWYSVATRHVVSFLKNMQKYWLSCLMYLCISGIFAMLTFIEPSIKSSSIHVGGSFDMNLDHHGEGGVSLVHVGKGSRAIDFSMSRSRSSNSITRPLAVGVGATDLSGPNLLTPSSQLEHGFWQESGLITPTKSSKTMRQRVGNASPSSRYSGSFGEFGFDRYHSNSAEHSVADSTSSNT